MPITLTLNVPIDLLTTLLIIAMLTMWLAFNTAVVSKDSFWWASAFDSWWDNFKFMWLVAVCWPVILWDMCRDNKVFGD